MKVFDMILRFAMPGLVLFTMIAGFAVGHSLAKAMFDPLPWSFMYNMVSGLIGTIIFSLALVKFSRMYFQKQFEKTVQSMKINPHHVFEEAGNGLAIDVDEGKVAFIDQGTSVLVNLTDIDRLESGYEQKSKLNKSVVNSTLHVYTRLKSNSLITLSFGLNSNKRDKAARQLEASISSQIQEG